ncbi:hypothetical protein TNCT_584031 [Trichonephila clavata]|uniref:Uncharacterized protein n=1 Tax=Trichonephila clavata TaxID=2740835 RepID=A0A8X6GIF9_TRICU|nr:hypothetical protein TNCT_584031 [Trichonephila clavata]
MRLLKSNETIPELLPITMDARFSRILKKKLPENEQRRDKLNLQHSNAQPHVAALVKKFLETLKEISYLTLTVFSKRFFRQPLISINVTHGISVIKSNTKNRL